MLSPELVQAMRVAIRLDELRDNGLLWCRVRERSQRREVVDMFAARAEDAFGETTFAPNRVSDPMACPSRNDRAPGQHANRQRGKRKKAAFVLGAIRPCCLNIAARMQCIRRAIPGGEIEQRPLAAPVGLRRTIGIHRVDRDRILGGIRGGMLKRLTDVRLGRCCLHNWNCDKY